nr:S1/P1 nuclease [Burkholderiaceae bacterium]
APAREHLHQPGDDGLQQRGASKAAAASATVVDLDLTRAAQESCRIVTTPGFYPPHTLPADYVERFAPVLEQRLVLAGARLAGWLNRVLP